MKLLLAAASAVAISISGAAAQNSMPSASKGPVANPTQSIANFDAAQLAPVLNELGLTWQQGTLEDGSTVIGASDHGDINFIIAPVVCSQGPSAGCVGLQLVALFNGDPNPQTVRAFNDQYPFSQTGLDPNGGAYISRYEIADFGMPRGNLATSILVFVEQVKMFRNVLATAGRTVALEGYADDLAAASLNNKMLVKVNGEESAPLRMRSHEVVGFSEMKGELNALLADKKLPRNKLENFTKK